MDKEYMKRFLKEQNIELKCDCGNEKFYMYFDYGAQGTIEPNKIIDFSDALDDIWDFLFIRLLCSECDKELIHTEYDYG